MALSWNEDKRQWEWEGSVKGLVDAVGGGDARLGFVLDKKSGAKISMNIAGTDDPLATEPFFVESPDGENLYDASNKREAIMLLSNIRKGMTHPDTDAVYTAPPKRKTKVAKKKPLPRSGVRGIRGR